MPAAPRVRRFLGLIGASVLAAATLAAPVAAGTPTTWYVDDDGTAGAAGCDGAIPVETSIQDAIDAAAARDIVLVCPGTYTEQIVIAKRGLTLRSVTPWDATIRTPKVLPGGLSALVAITASNVRLQWFRLVARTQSPCTSLWAAVRVSNGATGVIVRSESIGTTSTANTLGSCGYYVGVEAADQSAVRVLNTVISRFKYHGVDVNYGATGNIYRASIRYWHQSVCVSSRIACVAAAPASFAVSGVLLSGVGTVISSVISGTEPGGTQVTALQVGIDSPSASVLKGNRITSSTAGIQLYGAGATAVRNTIRDGAGSGIVIYGTGALVKRNRVTDMGTDGILAANSSSGNTITNNNALGNGVYDCHDLTGFDLPAGNPIVNTWTNNLGNADSPTGLCTDAAP